MAIYEKVLRFWLRMIRLCWVSMILTHRMAHGHNAFTLNTPNMTATVASEHKCVEESEHEVRTRFRRREKAKFKTLDSTSGLSQFVRCASVLHIPINLGENCTQIRNFRNHQQSLESGHPVTSSTKGTKSETPRIIALIMFSSAIKKFQITT